MDHEFRSAEERRAAIVALTQKETGIDETMIERLIRAFYVRVRQDALLAPVFESRISDWEPHLENMFAFWSSLTLMTGRYHGQPMAKHMPLPVDAQSFRSVARAVRRDGARSLSASRRRAVHRTRASRRREPRARRRGRERSPAGERRALSRGGLSHLSENNVSRTLPLSPITHTSVCGLVVLVRST